MYQAQCYPHYKHHLIFYLYNKLMRYFLNHGLSQTDSSGDLIKMKRKEIQLKFTEL